eukprot:TRINITY_DN5218_c0_g1_i2.p1 TRINITY_DN5218_c0_g1~~TRINITY_DN5218_c0_g1_i2.p1  ORF type:complete len:319 (-),score=41.12 TRINITY_DN5218_c0_g1_i2:38-994(-)
MCIRDRLNSMPADDEGNLTLKSSYILNMANLCSTSKDVQILLRAYYNFLGHKVLFSSSAVDQIILKATECDAGQLTHDILYNHQYLAYFPSLKVTNALMARYNEHNQVEHATSLLQNIIDLPLMKLDYEFFRNGIELFSKNQDANTLKQLFKLSKRKRVNLSSDDYTKILEAITQDKIKNSKNSIGKKEFEIFESLKDAPGTLKLTILQAFLYANGNQPENAIDQLIKLITSEKATLSEGEFLFDQGELSTSLFSRFKDTLFEAEEVVQSKFVKLVQGLREGYGDQAFAPSIEEILNEMSESDKPTEEVGAATTEENK